MVLVLVPLVSENSAPLWRIVVEIVPLMLRFVLGTEISISGRVHESHKYSSEIP